MSQPAGWTHTTFVSGDHAISYGHYPQVARGGLGSLMGRLRSVDAADPLMMARAELYVLRTLAQGPGYDSGLEIYHLHRWARRAGLTPTVVGDISRETIRSLDRRGLIEKSIEPWGEVNFFGKEPRTLRAQYCWTYVLTDLGRWALEFAGAVLDQEERSKDTMAEDLADKRDFRRGGPVYHRDVSLLTKAEHVADALIAEEES